MPSLHDGEALVLARRLRVLRPGATATNDATP
jgi:hypothetical protein